MHKKLKIIAILIAICFAVPLAVFAVTRGLKKTLKLL